MKNILIYICLIFSSLSLSAQSTIKGKILDGVLDDVLIGANVTVKGTTDGTITDYDGTFELNTNQAFPLTLVISYLGYETQEIGVNDATQYVETTLTESSVQIAQVEVKASRISEENKKSALTVESLDAIAIKETASSNFYEGLGSLKNVDLTTASLGFQVVNTRGFNSTSPVRSLQIIDGVDNQAPGLNFSLGNFLGASELDVNKVDLVVGASSAFYGPNAFNGVIKMDTKDPFFQYGLAASVKVGEREMLQTEGRWADVLKNGDGNAWMAYKINGSFMRANDWEAENYDPVFDTEAGVNNPGGYDAVNVYGDEYLSGNDASDQLISQPGLGIFHRTGYREIDLVDYGTRNYKANVALHFRTKPSEDFESPEILVSSSFGGGNTVYQGDNRFSLRGITFLQNKIEYRKKNKYFLRAYSTTTTAGDSYDPYFTALRLQEIGKENREWNKDYTDYWLNEVKPQAIELGFPQPVFTGIDPDTGLPIFDFDINEANQWLIDNNSLVTGWHKEAAAYSNEPSHGVSGAPGYLVPGSAAFQQEFDRITSTLRDGTDGGTRFHDQSSLYHIHGEYKINSETIDEITVGANGRLYTPKSKGTIFDDKEETITNREFGVYAGISHMLIDNLLKGEVTARLDKNENFDYLNSQAASLVWTPAERQVIRISYSSAIRNPTLSDQYLNLNVGPAILAGNINGVDSLVSVDNVRSYLNTQNQEFITDNYFSIEGIKPEEVQTVELGIRSSINDKLYVDAGYYFSSYNNFIGYTIGIDENIDFASNTINSLQAYRYAANAQSTVTTQGASIGLNYYFAPKYVIQGNYSWNKLNTKTDDPIIPAFNTPEHKYNIGINGRDITVAGIEHVGFNVNYKWIEGFVFEGSPQFTGFVPTYDLLDAQVNVRFPKIHTTVKLGASNLLNNKRFQTYGGPRIGRLGYLQLTYDFSAKK